jgi:lysophospholipase L1-like esterase
MNISRHRLAVFAAIAVAGCFLCVEILLRMAGFHFQRGLSYMRFGYPNPGELHNVFIRDPELLWRMQPGFDFGEGFEPLNRKGFRGKDFEKEKGEGIIRIACLGDSVTFGREDESYPNILSHRLEELNEGSKYEVINMGVPGYSSWQGKKLLWKQAFDLEPDIIVWLFGWNDHWLAHGFKDSDQVIENSSVYEFRDRLQRLRIYQGLNFIIVKMTGKPAAKRQNRIFRVPLEQYKSILEEVGKECRDRGIPIIMLTAPAGFGLAELPDFFLILGFIDDEGSLPELHARYNQAVREVAKGQGAALVDADLIFKSEGVKNFFEQPEKDIIHPNRKGFELIADAIIEEMKAKGWINDN